MDDQATRGGRHRRAWPVSLLVGVAVLSGVAGLFLALDGAGNQTRSVRSVGSAGDLTLRVSRGGWVAHEMDMGTPGMAMEGMPADGFRRLHLEVAMTNRGAQVRSFGPDQFRLQATGGRWALTSSSFVTGALGPGQAMAGDLFFDVPETATADDLALAWKAPGHKVLFSLSDALGPAGHQHDDDHEHDIEGAGR